MIKLEHVVLAIPEQMSFIIQGLRNPMNSWEKSDSYPGYDCTACGRIEREGYCNPKDHDCSEYFGYEIGPNDRGLMQRLSNAGTDHRKFMRMMPVYVRITAPLYWWKEFDTYKVGTVANSCSTMHKIHEKEFALEDFSCEYLMDENDITQDVVDEFSKVRGFLNSPIDDLKYDIEKLNMYRIMFLRTNDKRWWWQMIQRLPINYNQTRNVMLNYEVLANIYKSRNNHKLDEWREFCSWIKTLPYQELITQERTGVDAE